MGAGGEGAGSGLTPAGTGPGEQRWDREQADYKTQSHLKIFCYNNSLYVQVM